jgi:branched-chain amino acid transport system substrate-binding protein
MKLTRRDFTISGALLATAAGLPRPALADSGPIRMGWLAALTGPSSAPSVGFNRGVIFAAAAVNAAGGIKGRHMDIITRDTQGIPTTAVNATQEMISSARVDAIWGPANSGEALAVTPIMARAGMPNIHPCVLDKLIDPARYPQAFRLAPSNTQWDDAVRHYCLDILKAKKVAIIGDTTGYGVTAANDSAKAFTKAGADVVYKAMVDQTQPDLKPNMLHAKNGGAEAIVVWSVSTGLNARLFDTRAALNWDVPFVGHPSLASGDIGKLLSSPKNWDKVYAVGYKSCSYDGSGKLPARSQELVDRLKNKVDLSDTLLWWVAAGVDAVNLVAKAVAETGSSNKKDIVAYWNSLSHYPGYFGDYAFSKTNHNGYPTSEIVMSKANSGRNGTFALAPGYS